jgi:hypothetical protein
MELGLNYLWPNEVFYGIFEDSELLEDVQNYLLSDTLASSVDITSQDYSLFEIKNNTIKEFQNKCIFYFENYLKKTNIQEPIESFKLKAWTRSFKNKNSSLLYHNHGNSLISAIFYILVDNFDSGGQLILHDPRINANRGYSKVSFKSKFENKIFRPKTGDFIIFPSFLYHHVEKNNNSTRILIAVDLI